jgi:hypothetical protein
MRQSIETKVIIKALDNEIKDHFYTIKLKNVRRTIAPGNTQSLWKGVKIAHDVNVTSMPNQMYSEKIEVLHADLSDSCAAFFNKKLKIHLFW